MDVPPSLITYLPRLRDARKRLASVVAGSPRSRVEREGPVRAVPMRAPGEEAMPVRTCGPSLLRFAGNDAESIALFSLSLRNFIMPSQHLFQMLACETVC